MCQLVPSENGVDIPKIFGFEGLCAIVPSSPDVSSIFLDAEIVDGNASNVTPPLSNLDE
jgi:hypothetical protein